MRPLFPLVECMENHFVRRLRARWGVPAAVVLGVTLVACAGAPARPAAPAPPGSAPAQVSGSAPAPAAAPTPPPRARLKTAYTSLNASFAPIWLAYETGAFAEQGIDAELTFIGPGQAILGALISQETPLVVAGGSQIVEATLQGGDYVILGATSARLPIAVLVVPSIQRPEELRGKALGVSNFGAISHVGLKAALEHWGLVEGTDVTVIRSGGTPETIAAIQTGTIHGGAFGPPQSFRSGELGLRQLIDVSTLGYEVASNAIVSTRGYVAQQPAVVEGYLKAAIRGIHTYKTNKDLAVELIMRYGKLDDPVLAEQTWTYYRDHFEDGLVISRSMIENTLKSMADSTPEALTARPEQFLDSSFAERIRASGYVEQVRSGTGTAR
jgi:NitT/TauT family transport system substrate-binding protein